MSSYVKYLLFEMVKVIKINTFIDTKHRKKAYVKFSEETPAIDLATQLGLM